MLEATKHYSHSLRHQADNSSYVWICEDTIPFHELLITWNALRPLSHGEFTIQFSLKINDWTDWLPYAFWGYDTQGSHELKDASGRLLTCQDIIKVNYGQHATGFKIRVHSAGSAAIKDFFSLHAAVSRPDELFCSKTLIEFSTIALDVPHISQICLSHSRHRHLCSPTSTSAVVAYLLKQSIDPLAFALKAHDKTFDIFGNWVLNAAHAATLLGNGWNCWVQYLNGFHEIYQRLRQNWPVVVSVRGPLPGSAEPYQQGHLMVVCGFDAKSGRVLCMDPAFPSDSATNVSYDLADFLEAWRRRNCVAYIFEEKENPEVRIQNPETGLGR